MLLEVFGFFFLAFLQIPQCQSSDPVPREGAGAHVVPRCYTAQSHRSVFLFPKCTHGVSA